MIKRSIKDSIISDFKRNKVIVVLGARQVGKSTLLSEIGKSGGKILSLNCDDMDDAMLLEGRNSTALRSLLQGYDMVFIDEAQRVKNIGLTLKMIHDLNIGPHVVVTGSSSLDMSNEINEPATGRLIEYNLYPFSLRELADHTSEREELRLLNQRLVYGLYPEVVMEPADAKRTLVTLANNYLFKDLLSYKGLKRPEMLIKLVRALALQLGSEVSYNELGQLLGIDKATVETYISLLEKCFVVFRLDSYSRNMRNEIKRGKKVYFYDNGIRNAVISNFAPVELRTDIGALWENLMVSERIKHNTYNQNFANLYFWRNHQQQEIDLIEEVDWVIHAYEFKWNPRAKASFPGNFKSAYPESDFKVITPENLWEFV